jgi:sulfonate transport system permease protein
MTDLSHWAHIHKTKGGLRARRPRLPKFPALPLRKLKFFTGLAVPAWLFAVWYGVTAAHWVPDQILPAPAAVWEAFGTLTRSGDLQTNLSISLSRVGYGFGAGTLAGLLLGAGMGFSDGFARFVRPTFLVISQIPILAWLPFLMLLLGIGEALKIVLVAKAVFTPVTLSTCAGIRDVPARYLELARLLQLSRLGTLRRVVLPAALPQLFSGFRYGLTHAWLSLVAVELLASYEGVGYLMVYSRQLFQLDVMMAVMLVIAAAGLLLDRLLSLGEAWLGRRYGGAP